jgi:hypothetical protein
MAKSTWIRFRVIAHSTWKKSPAGMVEACARRNGLQEVSVARSGAGDMRLRLRILRIVEAPQAVAELEQFA